MAVDPPVLYNGYWVSTRVLDSAYGSHSQRQIDNAYQFRAGLQAQGYCEKAIAGILGCAQVESGINPGAIQKWSVLPNNAESLSDVPNSVMLQYYRPTAGGQGYGLGFLQWDRYSSTYHTHDLLGWEDRNGYVWYDGAGQLARLEFEYTNDAQYHFWQNNYGARLTWTAYKNIETTFPTYNAGEVANVWTSCWERSSLDPSGRQHRRDNAEYWYQYFHDNPDPPTPPTPPTPSRFSPKLIPLIVKRKKVEKVVKRFY